MLACVTVLVLSLGVAFYSSLAIVTDNEILAVAQIHILDEKNKISSDGSATIISPDGYLITNYHVIEPAVQDHERVILLCLTTDARKPPLCSPIQLELTAYNDQVDLALLKIKAVLLKSESDWKDFDEFLKENELTVNHVRLDRTALEENIRLGERMQILGYPLAGGRSITYTEGVVSGFERMEVSDDWEPWLIKTDAKLNPGGSGGAAFDQENNFIGVPTLVRGGVGNIGYIISLPVVNAFLDATGLVINTSGLTRAPISGTR